MATKKELLATLKSKASADFDYTLEQTFKAIPGTIVKVLLEFPDFQDGKSAIIELDDVVTLAYSIYRVKAPVVLLGNNSVDGYGLGVRTVAGTMIRSVFFTDQLTDLQVKCYLLEQEKIAERLNGLTSDIPVGLPTKDMLGFMKDDLSSFNIHMLAVSEEQFTRSTGDLPLMRQEVIIGAMIINNGQTYSVEDLITESTFSFQAKAVRSTSDPTKYSFGFGESNAFKTISSLL